MTTRFFYTFILLLTISPFGFCQNPPGFDKLPPATQKGLNQLAAKHRTGPVNYLMLDSAVKKTSLDLSRMPIEDAVMMLMMLIANDARKDMNEMLKEMNATRLRRSAMRESEDLLKNQLDSLRNRTRGAFDRTPADSQKTKIAISEKQLKLQQYTVQQRELILEENKATEAKKNAELHLRSVEDAIERLRLQQSQIKRQ